MNNKENFLFMSSPTNRRTFFKETLLSSAGLALAAKGHGQETAKSAPVAAVLPKGKIGKLEISRLILGGNLLTHFTHSRDLKYVYNLAAHYNTDEKILETLALAEANGINTLVIHNPPHAISLLRRYRKEWGGKIQLIICPTAPVEPDLTEYRQAVEALADNGTEGIYVWGVQSDSLVAKGKVELIAEAVELIKEYGVPAGVGGHSLEVIKACEQQGINPDFYIKTFHHHKYPGAPKPEQIKGATCEVPGYWCSHPEETSEFMKTVTKPWIAFKVMAAGAIPPQDAFQYAFSNGADFVLAGMFDFEIAGDVRMAKAVLDDLKERPRPWRA
jgi:hypothetical protein